MIKYSTGDIFDAPSDILVCPVNTVGVMGKGLALQFKWRYPLMFQSYRVACRNNTLRIGRPWLWESRVLCFPTKRHWREPSHIAIIESGLRHMCVEGSIAFPRLGCGLGGLDWKDVKPLMESYLSQLQAEVLIYE